jgi:hypothetical protein
MLLPLTARPSRVFLLGTLITLSSVLCGSALANDCGVLPFTSGRGVSDGAAGNITSLISSEVDIRGGFGLVLTAGEDEVSSSCGKKSSCVKEFGAENGYDRVVSGNVDNLGKTKYRISVKLWDITKGKEIREVGADIERAPDALVMAIPDLVIELLTGKNPGADKDEEVQKTSSFEEAEFGDDEDFEADFEEEEDSSADTKWMERDRRGRKIKTNESSEEDLLDFDELDDLDDLDLDGMTEDSQRKKSAKKEERREREAKKREEEQRLRELAREEENRREQERRREEALRAERERERRAAEEAEAKRRDREEREARRREERDRARAEERRREDERRRAEERRREEERERERSYVTDDDEEIDDFEDYELDDEEEVIEIESSISLGGGLVMVEDEDGEEDDYFGPEDEDGASFDDRDDSDNSRSRASDDEDFDLDIDLDSEDTSSDRSDLEFGRERESKTSYSSTRGRVSRSSSSSKREGPTISIKAGAGWTAYYPETLALGMFNYGFEFSFYALPWLSIDAGANFWSVTLVEYDEQGQSTDRVRTLPSFLFGATWHGNFHKVIRPYAGIDIGALLYAQAIVQEGTSNQIRPLFAPTVAADIGVDFVVMPNFGLFVGGKFGITYAARVQETVNSSWDPTTGLAEVWAGALVQF